MEKTSVLDSKIDFKMYKMETQVATAFGAFFYLYMTYFKMTFEIIWCSTVFAFVFTFITMIALRPIDKGYEIH